MTKGLYDHELKEITVLLEALGEQDSFMYITIPDVGAKIPLTVERGKHGKATQIGYLEFDGSWTFVPTSGGVHVD